MERDQGGGGGGQVEQPSGVRFLLRGGWDPFENNKRTDHEGRRRRIIFANGEQKGKTGDVTPRVLRGEGKR